MEKIDIVIPYVDSEDSNWQKLFNEYNPNKGEEIESINAKNRFRGQGNFFKYWFRCVETYLPWINKIHLIVQSESQIPTWLNKEKVHIVYHSDIIPEEYLPTFNSTCIEMFLWKIEDLSEYFLYANDDNYPFSYLKPEYFFNFNNKKIKTNSRGIKFLTKNYYNSSYLYFDHIFNSYCLAYDKNIEYLLKNNYLILVPSFGHSIRPYIRSNMEKHFIIKEPEIKESLSKFREHKNINIYYFDDCLIKDRLQEPRTNILSRVINSTTSDKDIINVLKSNYNILTINDTQPETNIYENFYLNKYFKNKFPFKSKYEI